MNNQLQGTVTSYLANRGFGFIKREDGENDVFFHFTNFPLHQDDIRSGLKVSFDIENDIRTGRRTAINIKFVD